MTVFLWLLLAFSLLFNVVLFRASWRRTGSAGANPVDHTHTWTPWSEFAKMEPALYSGSGTVHFRRVQYCTECGQERAQKVGQHACDEIVHGRHCPHKQAYTEIFDPLYDLKMLDRELDRMKDGTET